MSKKMLPSLLVLFGLTLLAACAAPVSPTPSATAILPAPTPTRFVIRITEPASVCPALSAADLAAQIAAGVGQVQAALDAVLAADEGGEMQAQIEIVQANLAGVQDAIFDYQDYYTEVNSGNIDLLYFLGADLEMIDTLLTELAGADENDIPGLADQLAGVLDVITLPAQAEFWQAQVQMVIAAREKLYMGVQAAPDQVANNRIDAFIQAHAFVDAYEAAVEDGHFSPDELAAISQLAARAESSLYNTGDHQVFGFANTIDDLTRQAARGEWPLTCDGIVDLRYALPSRPGQ